MSDQATHIHIFYTDPANGWCELHFNANGDQVGEANHHFKKSWAIRSASEFKLPVHIYGKNGLFQRTAQNATASK